MVARTPVLVFINELWHSKVRAASRASARLCLDRGASFATKTLDEKVCASSKFLWKTMFRVDGREYKEGRDKLLPRRCTERETAHLGIAYARLSELVFLRERRVCASSWSRRCNCLRTSSRFPSPR